MPMQHTIVVSGPPYIDAEAMEAALTKALNEAEVVAHREIHRPFVVEEYHHERMVEVVHHDPLTGEQTLTEV